MMKRFLIAAIALATTLPAAVNVQAQDDDIYFSKKAHKKATTDAVYAETASDEWSTDANNDWDLDAYNRRGNTPDSASTDSLAEPAFYYEIADGKGNITKVPGNDKMLKNSDLDVYKVKNDTVILVEQYYYSDLIRRFHNPFFGYYRYSPWYDVAYYDPFYWDYCYYDPWWYVTPSFGFHWGSWYGGWSFGYYSGWYGGWYSPYYCPMPHYFHYNHPIYVMNGNYVGSHRGSSRNNFGGHFAHRGGWRGDGGNSRLTSASSNRSYRAANGARTSRIGESGIATNGPTLRGRNAINGRIANSNMRSSSRIGNTRTSDGSVSRGNNGTRYSGSTATGSRRASRNDNSSYRRADAGMRQRDNGSTAIRNDNSSRSYSYDNHNSSRYDSSNSSRQSSSPSYNTRSSSSGSYSGGHSSGGGYSGGGSHSGGGRSGRR